MSADLLTEEQARLLSPAGAVVVREVRGIANYIMWLILTVFTAAGFSYPFWRGYIVPEPHFPPFIAVFGVLFGLLFVWLMGRDLQAASQPSAWLLRADARGLLFNFRSFHHWSWPRVDRIVLRLPAYDISEIRPRHGIIRTQNNNKGTTSTVINLLEFTLAEPLSPELIAAIQYENTHMGGSGKSRTRYQHTPLRASVDGRTLCLDMGTSTVPSFNELRELLAKSYRVQSPTGLDEATAMASAKPRLTADQASKIEMLAAAGDKMGAISLLREHSGISLSEASTAVQQGRVAQYIGYQS